MDPADAIARIADLQILSSVGWILAVMLAGVLYVVGKRHDDKEERGCVECSHCRAEYVRRRKAAEEEFERKTRDNLRALGLTESQIEDFIRRRKGR